MRLSSTSTETALNALVAVAGGENLGGAVHQGDVVVAGGGEQLGDCGADLAGSDHGDVLHAFSGRSSEFEHDPEKLQTFRTRSCSNARLGARSIALPLGR